MKGPDHPRNAFALIRAYASGDLIAAGQEARQRGIVQDHDACRETMYATANIAVFLLRQLANSTGRDVKEELELLGLEIEVGIRALHDQLGTEENPPDPT